MIEANLVEGYSFANIRSELKKFDGWDNLEDADVLPDPESKAQTNLEDVDDEVDADDGHATQVPRGLPAPVIPS